MASIGIDLGTTNCYMAVCKGNKVDVIPYSSNSRTLPSYISFWNQEILFGDEAINRMSKNIENTVYDIKRLIGRRFSDPVVTSHLDKWDFKVIDKNGSVAVCVANGDEKVFYTPEELCGLLLTELKTKAEAYLGVSVSKVVITIPTYFTDSQRQATMNAGRIAGFKEVRLLKEPTAVALAYDMKNLQREKRTMVVFDFGGGTFDISLVECEGENVRAMAIGGDQDLGGNDIDQLLVEYMVSNHDLKLNQKQLLRLRKVCKEAKKRLSVSEEVDVELADGTIDMVLKRNTFNEICKDIFAKIHAAVQRCLNGNKFDVEGVNEILVVGGSSKIQRIVTMLETHFKKPVWHTVNPNEVVAMGAAICASRWDFHSSFEGVNFTDICPYSLGICISNINEPENRLMSVLIKRHSPLPVKNTEFYLSSGDQPTMNIRVFSGEDVLVKNNKCLAHIEIEGLPSSQKRKVREKVIFELDINGILNVSVVYPEHGISKHLKLVLDKGGYKEEELRTTIDVIQKRYSKSLDIKNFKQRKNHLADLCETVKTQLEHLEFNAENSQWLEDAICDLKKH